MCQRAIFKCWPCESIRLSTTEIQSGVEDAAALRSACHLSPSWLSLGAQIVVVGMCWAERTWEHCMVCPSDVVPVLKEQYFMLLLLLLDAAVLAKCWRCIRLRFGMQTVGPSKSLTRNQARWKKPATHPEATTENHSQYPSQGLWSSRHSFQCWNILRSKGMIGKIWEIHLISQVCLATSKEGTFHCQNF